MKALSQENITMRIRETLDREQRKSEIIVSWTQFAFIFMLFSLWLVSPAAHSGSVLFEPVPVILAFYAPFIIFRLILSHQYKVSQGLVFLSIIIDIVMLTALIYSFHIQYFQTPQFYLKAPTYFYFLMFIGLRTLRFDVYPVIFAGILACLAWIGLTIYAYNHETANVTNSFVEWANGPFLLVGAEVEKTVFIVIMTVILTITTYRSRNLLRQSVEAASSFRKLSRFFNPTVAMQITSLDKLQPGRGNIRQATILFIDIRGFTALANSISPDEVMALLTQFQGLIAPIIGRNNGIIDKFLGDGMMVHFGALNESDCHAADCLRAMEEVTAKLDDWNGARRRGNLKPLEFGMGADSGDLIFGTVGDDEKLELTTIGTVVNRASKIEKHTKGQNFRAYITRTAYDLAIHQDFRSKSIPIFANNETIQGIQNPLDLVGLFPTKNLNSMVS